MSRESTEFGQRITEADLREGYGANRQTIGWAVLELMGHRKLAGRVEEATLAGGAFLRIDVYLPAGSDHDGDRFEDEDGAPLLRIATQFYPPGSVYCLTPTTRDMCLALTARNQPAPVARWELPAEVPVSREDFVEAAIDGDDGDEFGRDEW